MTLIKHNELPKQAPIEMHIMYPIVLQIHNICKKAKLQTSSFTFSGVGLCEDYIFNVKYEMLNTYNEIFIKEVYSQGTKYQLYWTCYCPLVGNMLPPVPCCIIFDLRSSDLFTMAVCFESIALLVSLTGAANRQSIGNQ